eukprot:GABW01001173.1.p2 GENE.GABW01001173.1~~GABW01001173.1.p2  ORF type:complete len:56 (+),score=16.16 GABW01001173.1:178-345(+)
MLSTIPWATVDPFTLDAKSPHEMKNIVGGEWKCAAKVKDIVDPLNGDVIIKMPNT